jgi:hypothetical protein
MLVVNIEKAFQESLQRMFIDNKLYLTYKISHV